MFCSKCGKEIAEGSAFCPGCGQAVGGGQQAVSPEQKVVYVKRVGSKFAGSSKEVKTKTAVFCMYVIGSLFKIIISLLIITSRFGIIADQITLETGLFNSSFKEEFEKAYDEYQVIIWFIFILLLVGIVFGGIELWKNCVDRKFADKIRDIIVSGIETAILGIFVSAFSCILVLGINDYVKVSFSVLYWVVLFGVLLCKAVYLIIYSKAIRLETGLSLRQELYFRKITK